MRAGNFVQTFHDRPMDVVSDLFEYMRAEGMLRIAYRHRGENNNIVAAAVDKFYKKNTANELQFDELQELKQPLVLHINRVIQAHSLLDNLLRSSENHDYDNFLKLLFDFNQLLLDNQGDNATGTHTEFVRCVLKNYRAPRRRLLQRDLLGILQQSHQLLSPEARSGESNFLGLDKKRSF